LKQAQLTKNENDLISMFRKLSSVHQDDVLSYTALTVKLEQAESKLRDGLTAWDKAVENSKNSQK
jgi:hypothetical protein